MSNLNFTRNDELNQDRIVTYLSEKWDCGIWRFPAIVSNIDYVAGRHAPGSKYPKVTAFIEIKCNSGSVQKPLDFGHVWVDLTKVEAFVEVWKMFKVPSMYVVGFDDGLVFMKWTYEENPYTQIMEVGRRDRGDPNDVRLACKVPVSVFKVIRYEGSVHADRESA